MLLTVRESLLLKTLLHNGGICTSSLIGNLLCVSVQEARVIAQGLVDRGWLVIIPLNTIRGRTRYFQISRRAARYFGYPNAAAARYTRREESSLQGLSRFWFRVNHSGHKFIDTYNEIIKEFESRDISTQFSKKYFSETIVSVGEEMHVYAFPSLDNVLQDFVKSTLIKYSAQISKIRIGFVIDKGRFEELEKILALFNDMASGFHSDQEDYIEESIPEFETEMERMHYERKLKKGRSEGADLISRIFCKTIIHDAY